MAVGARTSCRRCHRWLNSSEVEKTASPWRGILVGRLAHGRSQLGLHGRAKPAQAAERQLVDFNQHPNWIEHPATGTNNANLLILLRFQFGYSMRSLAIDLSLYELRDASRPFLRHRLSIFPREAQTDNTASD